MNRLKKIKIAAATGMILMAIGFGTFFYIYKQADMVLSESKLDQTVVR